MSSRCTWIGSWEFSWTPIVDLFSLWPRNFAVAFAVEALIAHPVAHAVMHRSHVRKDRSAETGFPQAASGTA